MVLGNALISQNIQLIIGGGQGVINIKTTERNGQVVALIDVRDTDELIMITAKGMVIRTPINTIRAIGRNTQGVKLFDVEEGDKLVSVARVAPEETTVETDSGEVLGIETQETAAEESTTEEAEE